MSPAYLLWMPACFAKPKEAVRIDATVPTREIREALAEQEVPLPDEDGLLALSSEFNERLKRSRATTSTSSRTFQHASASWMDMFNELDLDHSGEITFDELRRVVRGKLSWPVAELPGSTRESLVVRFGCRRLEQNRGAGDASFPQGQRVRPHAQAPRGIAAGSATCAWPRRVTLHQRSRNPPRRKNKPGGTSHRTLRLRPQTEGADAYMDSVRTVPSLYQAQGAR